MGEVIIYTGEGRRDPNTGRQVADQQFVGGNRALAENHLRGIPIRVHRGKAHAPDMPTGFRYRYDGLYRIASYWQETGRDGFKIWRFRIEKIEQSDDSAPPKDIAQRGPENGEAPSGNQIPIRRLLATTRVVRSTAVGEWVKRLHDFACQICGTRLLTMAGVYAETCHIKPLGSPHNGPDVPENILCLCPNCHVRLDELALWINDDLSIEGRDGFLRADPRHSLSSDAIQYHRRMCGH
jgi:putative restriction endonuclease